uniref:Cyanocobalamin reductase (cyanide-eliminating) n=1 Tax=Rhipicephalus appendiculatus TaxID=34631 RepID=A0A131YCX3_RHIAP
MRPDHVAAVLEQLLSPVGIETYPFKISWYNECVPDAFKFPHQPDTLCFVAISTPSTFEKAFLPFILDNRNSSLKDPYDQCMTACFASVKEVVLALDV